MFGKTKLFLIIASMLCMASCDTIREDLPRCELWLEFAFDYNMEYADAFNPQVKSVDVFVFGSDDKLLFSKRAEATALIGGNRMSLTNELDFGNYKVLTVGSLSDNFHALDNAGRELVPGTTTLRQLTVALKRASDIVDFEFQHLYFSGVVEVDHLPSNTDHKVYRVNLDTSTPSAQFQFDVPGEITCLKFYLYRNAENARRSYDLIVGSDKGGTDGGELRVYEAIDNLAQITDYKEYHSGFGRIVDIIYKEPITQE